MSLQKSSKVKLGLVQMRCSLDAGENRAKAIAKTREAAARGAQIVCLQELFTSVYFCQIDPFVVQSVDTQASTFNRRVEFICLRSHPFKDN